MKKIYMMIFLISLICEGLYSRDGSSSKLNQVFTYPIFKFYEIGEKLPNRIFRNKTKSSILTSSAQFRMKYSLSYKGVVYSYGIDEDRVIYYISTSDPGFVTSEGHAINSTFKEIKTKSIGKLECERGWSYYVPLGNGWNAGFFIGKGATDREPLDSDKVSFFFKRYKNG